MPVSRPVVSNALISVLLIFSAFASTPGLVVDSNSTIEFGDENNTRIARFSYHNNSPDSIKIISVRTSCGCVSLISDSSILQPWQKGSLQFRITGDEWPEGITKTIVIETDEKAGSPIVLRIAMPTCRLVELSEKSLFWAKANSYKHRTLRIHSAKPLQIKELFLSSTPVGYKIQLLKSSDSLWYLYVLPIASEKPRDSSVRLLIRNAINGDLSVKEIPLYIQ